MVRHPTDPLTVQEAKQALRHATQAVKSKHLIGNHPTSLLALAFSVGLIMGNPKSRRFALGIVEPILISYLIPRYHCDKSNASDNI